MCRSVLLLVVGILLTSTCSWGQDNSALGEAQVISQAMVEAVRKAEPAVASIFVSRSEDYRRLLKDSPPADKPGVIRNTYPSHTAAGWSSRPKDWS
jgi:hypothetical protein